MQHWIKCQIGQRQSSNSINIFFSWSRKNSFSCFTILLLYLPHFLLNKMNINTIDINPDRPLLVGPEQPTQPFPFALQGTVVKGYGRGSKQLGIPTGQLQHCLARGARN